MIFTAEEKKRIDNVMAAFGDYIREHEDFDIVYSDKVGYFRIWVPQMTYEAPKPLNSVDAMLEELFFQISGDVWKLKLVGYHDDIDLYPEEIVEVRRRAESILNTMSQDREYCFAKLDYYLAHVND